MKQDDKIQNKNSDRGTRGHSLSEEHFCDPMTQMKPFGAFCVKTTFNKQIRFIAFRFPLIRTYNNRQDGAQDKLAHCRTSSEHRGPGAEAEEDETEKTWKK